MNYIYFIYNYILKNYKFNFFNYHNNYINLTIFYKIGKYPKIHKLLKNKYGTKV